MIGPAGMEKFCSDLEVDPEDVRNIFRSPSHNPIQFTERFNQVVTLVMAYHLKAQQMGSFSKEEFMKGFESLGYDLLYSHSRPPLARARPYVPSWFATVWTHSTRLESTCPSSVASWTTQ